jgi:hypothetical protein
MTPDERAERPEFLAESPRRNTLPGKQPAGVAAAASLPATARRRMLRATWRRLRAQGIIPSASRQDPAP